VSQKVYGPKDFSMGLIQEMIITLGKKGFSPEMAKEAANAKSGKADEIVGLFGIESWLQEILERERQYHLDFFDQEFDLLKFEKTLKRYGHQKIQEWQNLGLEPHFLPKVSMMSGDDYRGWKIKPEKWFYGKIFEGKIFRDIKGKLEKVTIVKLEGITILIDTRLKPAYQNDRQMYEDDNLLGSIIEELRENRKIVSYKYGPQSSRFGTSADHEWEKQIKPVLAKKLGLRTTQIRLERAIEANVIPQLYSLRKDDGKTNTWVWYEEYFEGRGRRLSGGDSGHGGLADVYFDWAGDHWSRRALRPLAVL